MRRILLVWAVAAASVGCTTSPRVACVTNTGSALTVHGTATLPAKPDAVAFSVGVETRGSTVPDAFIANSRKVDAVVAALKGKGVTADEIQTTYFNVNPVTNRGRPDGFTVTNLVTVRRRDVASAADLLQAALSAGANQVGGLAFYVSDRSAFQQQGLELAFRDAHSKAEALAALSARTLGPVVCISDGTQSPRSDVNDRLASLGYVSSPTLESGTEQMAFTVSVVFGLQ
jgi:uncharacterized protein